MTALSSANLYQPLLVGSDHLERLDDLMWPSYRRVTLEQGGDHYAEFQINTQDHDVRPADLERWFLNWIGCHFVESYGAQDVFQGYVHSLTIYVGGVMRRVTLDDMYNDIIVLYTTDDAATKTATSAATDADSIAKYGTKELVYDTAPHYIAQTHAEGIRDELLQYHLAPRTSSGDVVISDDSAVLEVYVQGYSHTVGWKIYKQATDSASSTSTHISGTLLSGLDFVTAGDIDTISTGITPQSEYTSTLERIRALLEGEDMKWGCFGSRSFDINARDVTSIKYRRQAYGDRFGFFSGGRYVPEPLITPSGWLYTQDIFTGSGPDEADLRDDPRADWISQVEYSWEGVTLFNPEWSTPAINLALATELDDTNKREVMPWIDRARLTR